MKLKHGKRIWPLLLAALLFFIGVASILYPFFSNLLSVMTADTVISDYKDEVKDMSHDDIEALIEEAHLFNKRLYEGTVNKDDARCLSIANDLISYLDIPSISVYLPVYYGTSEEVLSKGCGYLENTSLPVGGVNTHCVIAGHTGLPTADMLTNLDRLKIGDLFYIHTLNDVLAYRVDKIQAVLPDMTDALRILPGRDIVTLLTCTPYGVNDHRLLVRGTRVPYDPEDETPDLSPLPVTEDERNAEIARQTAFIVVIVLASVIVFVTACFLLGTDSKKHKNTRHIDTVSIDEKREE